MQRRLSGRLLAAMSVSAGIAALWVSWMVSGVPYFPIDVTITRAIQSLSATVAIPLEALNVVGFPPVVTITYAVVVLIIFISGRRWEAAGAGLATLGAAGLTYLVKFLIDRPRPSPDLVHVAHQIKSTAYPAGHVLNMTAFVGFLCYLVWACMAPSWRRTALLVLLVSMIVLMGPARIYAGEHWPSDVLGAYLIALAWLPLTIAVYQRSKFRTRPGAR